MDEEQLKDVQQPISEPYRNLPIIERRRIQTESGMFDVMRSKTLCALGPVASYFATHVMNVISAHAVCVAYPLGTMNRTGVYTDRETTTDEAAAIRKYSARSYTLTSGTEHAPVAGDEEQSMFCGRTARFFGDDKCITLHFGMTSRRTARMENVFDTPTFRLGWTSAWVLGGRACGVDCCAVETRRRVEDVIVSVPDAVIV
ncbi:hypothetical protein NM688_g6399 [Phlebia brevispora]|uniref:Uncharacterized protein n=1 Tax=Phlebia brevispora TaxID=194682 RepID=A0ACC1SGF2_9APHY|nr:hypothetical protein NM688_g6399 [Phlebia brevispora]